MRSLDADPAPAAGPALRAATRAVRILCGGAAALAAALVLADLCLIGAAVFARYALNAPILWSDELVGLSLIAVVMLAAPQVLLSGGHVGVDILTSRLQGRARLISRGWNALGALAVALLLIANGWSTAMFSRIIGLVTDGELALPVWALQLMLPAGGALLAPVALLELWRVAALWRRGPGLAPEDAA